MIRLNNLYYCQVMGDDLTAPDGLQLGRIQVSIPPYTTTFPLTDLPYVYPLNAIHSGASVNSGVSNTPVVGSYVWCIFEDEEVFQRGYYVFDASFPTINVAQKYYTQILPSLSRLTTIPTPVSQYPDVVSFHYENGICIAYDRNLTAPVITTYHPSGSYTIINGTGNVGVFSANEIEITNQAGVSIYTTTGLLTIKNQSQTLKTIIDQLITTIENIQTIGPPPRHSVSPDSVTALENIRALNNQLFGS